MSWTGRQRVNDSRSHGLAVRWRNRVPCLDEFLMPRNCSNVGVIFRASTLCDFGAISMM